MTPIGVDVETGGLDPSHSLLQVGLARVGPDGTIQAASWWLRPDPLVLSAFVLADDRFRANALAACAKGDPDAESVACKVREWLRQAIPPGGRLTPVGINVARFDVPRVAALVGRDWWQQRVSHRCVELGTLYLRPEDDRLPNSATIFERAGVTNADPHDAGADAAASLAAYLAWQGGRRA